MKGVKEQAITGQVVVKSFDGMIAKEKTVTGRGVKRVVNNEKVPCCPAKIDDTYGLLHAQQVRIELVSLCMGVGL